MEIPDCSRKFICSGSGYLQIGGNQTEGAKVEEGVALRRKNEVSGSGREMGIF